MKPLRRLVAMVLFLVPVPASFASGSTDYDRCFEAAARLYQLDPNLLKAVAWVESGGNPDARSDRNAHGLMQIRWPVTARHLGVRRVAELYNPCLNIDLGARYLTELLKRFGDDESLALAAYNYGPSRTVPGRIPESVLAYVDKVQSRVRSLGAAENLSLPVLRGKVLLAGFASESRAVYFRRSLMRLVPGLVILSEDDDGMTMLYVQAEALDAAEKRQLARLLPEVLQ